MTKAALFERGSMGYHATLNAVRERDSHTCQSCQKKWTEGQRKFDVHHMNRYEGKNKAFRIDHKMDELITLCHRCHLNLPGVRRKMRLGKKRKQNG
jgi:hypothetical protein